MALALGARGSISSIKYIFCFQSQINLKSNRIKSNICGGGRTTIPRSTVGSMDQIPPAGTVSFADDDTLNRGRRTAATTAHNVELMGLINLEHYPKSVGNCTYSWLPNQPNPMPSSHNNQQEVETMMAVP